MGKVKSAILLTLITLVVAVLCVVCFVPFPLGGDGIHYFNPIINWAEKSADFGDYQFGEEAGYLGGSYSVVFYPEGVISAREHDALSAEDQADYTPYAEANGAIYLDKEKVCDGGETPTEEFKTAFEAQLNSLRARFERLHAEGTQLEVRDGYTVAASLPASMDASVAALLYYSYMGEVTVLYGTSSDAASATQVFPESGNKKKPSSEYIEDVRTRNNAGTAYVEVDFTEKGLELVSNASSGAADSTGYLFLQVGGNTVINLSISEQIHDNLYISGSYTADTANVVATTLSTALKYDTGDYGMTMADLYRSEAGFADLQLGSLRLSALQVAFVAIGVLFLAMAVLFFVRYGRLAFAHLLTYLTFLVLMVIIYWAVPLAISVGTLTAFALTSLLLCVSNAVAYEYARKEYAVGKTITSSVKTGYKKCFWHIFDLHIALLIVSLLVYLIALAELSTFALALLFGTALSMVGTLAMNRFMWYLTMGLCKDPGKFCHFKREEVEDDE